MRSFVDVLSPSRRWMAALVTLEFLTLVTALCVAAHIRFAGHEALVRSEVGSVIPHALVFALVIQVSLAAMGLYRRDLRERPLGQLVHLVVGMGLGGFALMVLFYAWPPAWVGRGILLISLALGLVGIVLSRVLFAWSMEPESLKRRVLIVGAGEKAGFLYERTRRAADRRGYWIVGYVPLAAEKRVVPAERCLEAPRGLPALCRELGVSEVVVAPDDRRGSLPMVELLECRLTGVKIVDALTFFEQEAGTIKVNLLEPSWLIYSEGFTDTNLRRASKRAFDVVIAAVMLVVTAPIHLAAIAAILIESRGRGPVFYRQERVGDHGRTFEVIKLRSMRTDAERDGVARWATSNDDRVTRVGRVIRKLRIDELPQLVNVLRGEMSFVGPRPERPQFVEQLSQELSYYPLRHAVKPGLTGWAQVRYPYGASVKDAEEKLKFDLYYVKNQSLMFDLMILLQTVEDVMFGRGAR